MTNAIGVPHGPRSPESSVGLRLQPLSQINLGPRPHPSTTSNSRPTALPFKTAEWISLHGWAAPGAASKRKQQKLLLALLGCSGDLLSWPSIGVMGLVIGSAREYEVDLLSQVSIQVALQFLWSLNGRSSPFIPQFQKPTWRSRVLVTGSISIYMTQVYSP